MSQEAQVIIHQETALNFGPPILGTLGLVRKRGIHTLIYLQNQAKKRVP